MKTPYFIEKIDWSELRNQKSTLIGLMNTCTTVEEAQTLEGLLSLIDATQDYAVDVMGMSSTDVFDFEQEDVREGYTGIDTMSETKTVYLCKNCNSDNVEIKHWVNPNTDYIGEAMEDIDDTWCNDCEIREGVYTSELTSNAHVIGFQVVGYEDCELSPDMDASFCIYSLSQARKMIENSDNVGNWRLLTIWNGDVEEPTLMFNGSPRD